LPQSDRGNEGEWRFLHRDMMSSYSGGMHSI
jgi:hypothetical protein